MVQTLRPAALDRARRFLKEEARPLDGALFEFRFEGAPAGSVAAALAAYQNDDGGFGHALEPDVRTPTSSPLATGIALTILKEIGYPGDHALVQGAIRYLLAALEPESQVWRAVPPDANEHAHAPWWHDEEGSLARIFDGFLIIPRAQLVGLLHSFSEEVPPQWLADLTERTVSDVETIDALGTGGGDDLAYALALAEENALPERFRARVLRRIRAVVPRAVNTDPAEWSSYCIHPLKIVHTPASPVADLIWDAIQADLDYRIDHQHPEGTWEPVWTWGGAYPSAWERARQEWRGHLTLETLTILRAFGRIEEHATAIEEREG